MPETANQKTVMPSHIQTIGGRPRFSLAEGLGEFVFLAMIGSPLYAQVGIDTRDRIATKLLTLTLLLEI